MKVTAQKPFLYKTTAAAVPPSIGVTGETLTKKWLASTIGPDGNEWAGFVRESGEEIFVPQYEYGLARWEVTVSTQCGRRLMSMRLLAENEDEAKTRFARRRSLTEEAVVEFHQTTHPSLS